MLKPKCGICCQILFAQKLAHSTSRNDSAFNPNNHYWIPRSASHPHLHWNFACFLRFCSKLFVDSIPHVVSSVPFSLLHYNVGGFFSPFFGDKFPLMPQNHNLQVSDSPQPIINFEFLQKWTYHWFQKNVVGLSWIPMTPFQPGSWYSQDKALRLEQLLEAATAREAGVAGRFWFVWRVRTRCWDDSRALDFFRWFCDMFWRFLEGFDGILVPSPADVCFLFRDIHCLVRMESTCFTVSWWGRLLIRAASAAEAAGDGGRGMARANMRDLSNKYEILYTIYVLCAEPLD